jgi:DNA-binding NarL/FixJ family response regulator
MIRVLLVDDQELFRSPLRLLLEHEDGIVPVGEAGTAEQAVIKTRALRPDVVLLDLVLPRRNGSDIIPDLRECPRHRGSWSFGRIPNRRRYGRRSSPVGAVMCPSERLALS